MSESPKTLPDPGPSPGAHASFLLLFPSIMLPMFLAVIDQTIVATALPAIAASLGDAEHVAWVVVSYLVATTSAAPVYGRLGDQFGRRRLMLVALCIFSVASLLCALATTLPMLIAARVLQGAGGGGLLTMSQALIGETIAPRERARYQGYIAGVAVTSSTFGPVVGGILTEHFGWQSIFLVSAPLGLVAALLILRLKPKPGANEPFRFDYLGLLLFVAVVSSVLVMVQQAQHPQSVSIVEMLPLLTLSIGGFVVLCWREARASYPLLPIALFRDPVIWRSDALAACHGALLVSLITLLPIYLRVVYGTSPAETGLLILPMTMGIGIGSIITGRFVSRTGRTAIFPSVGMSVVALLLICMAFFAPLFTRLQLSCYLGLVALFMGSVMSVVQVTVQFAAGGRMLGAGAATVQLSRALGAAIGTAAAGAVLFAVASMSDPGASPLLEQIIREGPDALSTLAHARQLEIRADIAFAFRTVFLMMTGFAVIACALAWSLPLRRI